MIIHDKVYDVTQFLEEHPGGEDILVDSSGRDATREFEDVGHSADARAMLDDYYVGDVREATDEELVKAKEEALSRGEDLSLSRSGNSLASTLAKFLLPFVIAGLAYLVRKYTSK